MTFVPLITFCFLVLTSVIGKKEGALAVAPNVLVILTDDQGFGDVEWNCDNTTSMCAEMPNMKKFALSPHSAVFHRFYATAAVCSPTRASVLTGRNNQRVCIADALPCCNEDLAPECAMGRKGSLPDSEFTFGDAAKKSSLGNYTTAMFGKWHLGDLWDKGLPDMNKDFPVSAPWMFGFDKWLLTQGEASSTHSNCGCFQVEHDRPGRMPRPTPYPVIPYGDECIVAGGYPSDWCYNCTNYYYANASDPRNVTDLAYKIPGDDNLFILDEFESFLAGREIEEGTADITIGGKDERAQPFLAYLTMHSIHEPHPALPEYYGRYERDPDYNGILFQFDVAFGRLMQILDNAGVTNDTVIIFSSDNGPHQGHERSDVHYSTGFLRDCKQSIFEGGLRVPGIIFAPQLIQENMNITTPAGSVDILPTIMDLLNVESNNPTFAMDGVSLLPLLREAGEIATERRQGHIMGKGEAGSELSEGISWVGPVGSAGSAIASAPIEVERAPETPLTFWFKESMAVVDNDWKLVYNPQPGQCLKQRPYILPETYSNKFFLFNIREDRHELYDRKEEFPDIFSHLLRKMNEFKKSVEISQQEEVGCTPYVEP